MGRGHDPYPYFNEEAEIRQPRAARGRAYAHRIPLAKLKCISPKRWAELAARRRGEEPGGAAQVKSRHHGHPPARYFDLVRDMKHPYDHRLRLVESVQQRGIKATARLFATTIPTVRKWFRRFQQHGPSGLVEHSRARSHQPHKTPPPIEAQLLELRKLLPTFGARRLIREFDLPVGHSAVERIWRENGLLKKRRRKYQRKQDLAHIKAQWALFQQISADTKDLDDIPHYWPQA